MSRTSPLQCVVKSLSLGSDERAVLRQIPESSWADLLHVTDESRLTLPLAIRCADYLPDAVRARVERSRERNTRRYARVVADWREIDLALKSAGVPYLVLKGLTHWPFYSVNVVHRAQYDFDFYCPDERITQAFGVIAGLGYEPLASAGRPETDHLPAMIRRTGFQWKRDYFDPDLPLAVELHHRFWNPARESFAVRNDGDFWARRTTRQAGDLTLPALDPVDCLTYATWHLVRHLLHGSLRLFHAYEIACFLHESIEDQIFWNNWREVYQGSPAIAEGVAFRLAAEWFGCRTHPAAQEVMGRLPPVVDRWFALFGDSPVRAQETPNKDELFLHLSLAQNPRQQLRIAMRKILPGNVPQIVLDAHSFENGSVMAARRAGFRMKFLLKRAVRHGRTLAPLARAACKWWRPR